MTEAMRALASGTPGGMTGYLVEGLKMDGQDVELLWVDTAGEREGTTCKGTWDLLKLGYTVPEPMTGRCFAGSGVPEGTDGGLDAYHRHEWVRWIRHPY